MSNHGNYPTPDMEKIQEQLGATRNFPQGKLVPHDEGEIRFAVGEKEGKVVIDFGKETAWVGMFPEQAIELAQILQTRAFNIISKKNVKESER